MSFLYEDIQAVKKARTSEDKVELPQYLIDNLSPNIVLRDYQKDAIEALLIYLNSGLSENKQTHLLYHMATGSGKTVIMAMNILYYYKQGYRKFLFFTNQTNIISKTKINFLDPTSSKYLFADTVNIDGKDIKIKEVDNFEDIDENAINICFNTVQGLHSALSLVREGALTIEDFTNKKIVLLADEAHHLNSNTAHNRTEDENNETWESTVNNVLKANKDNVLLEFTATCDIQDQNVRNKYLDKIIFNFDLREFRKAGYTKEFVNMRSNASMFGKALQAIIMSEYRKLIFEQHNVAIKPVVLLKSKTIAESNRFYSEFYSNLKNLSPSDIETIRTSNKDNRFFSEAFDFFDSINLSFDNLVDLIKVDFAESNSVNMNETDTNKPEYKTAESIVNNLDEKDNHYRLIFIVDKLTEGWDVLSLFDIVRLYETRQTGARGAISKYTISEAQLIGRGARYCPFKFEENQIKEKRKYSDFRTPVSICETLLYHCMDDSRYIDEIKRALQQTGLLPDREPIPVTYKLKDDFKNSKIYQEGFVFMNERKEISRNSITSLSDEIRTKGLSYKCRSNAATAAGFFDETNHETDIKLKDLPPVFLKDLPYNIVYKAFRCYYQALSFDKLKQQFPNLSSIKEFLTSTNYLGAFPITFFVQENTSPTASDMLEACKQVLQMVSDYVQTIEVTFKGTTEFHGKPINKVFTNRTINIMRDPADDTWGAGVSQNDDRVDQTYRVDLTNKAWYAYDDNYGTSEEKKFVKYFSSIVSDLEKEFESVTLIRNETQLCIYSFDDGSKFEPDYVLILTKKNTNGKKPTLYLCVFVEPKGVHLLKTDAWKNKFLLELTEKSMPIVTLTDDNEYRIWGTPLYNEIETKQDFDSYFKNLISSTNK